MATSRWIQDTEVAQLIEHLDQEGKVGQWDKLSAAEYSVVLKELQRCRRDFIYAARNYFWILTKRDGEKLFSLWPGQELILQKILEIKAKGQLQKILIIKGRQLGCSTLIEALIAWSTMFFSGRTSLVVSYDREHSAQYLFPIMQFIYDRLPWWLQPTTAGRRVDGIFFENPDPKSRGKNPGLNSRIMVKGANSTTGVGQGTRLTGVHCSEAADWDDHTAKEIIAEDMVNALVEGPDTFAIIETTAKGANRYIHRLWKKCVERAEEAEWYPLFLPSFFEDSRRRPCTVDFHIEPIDKRMRERVIAEWVRCRNNECRQYHLRFKRGEDRSGTICVTCNVGEVWPYELANEQLNWFQHRRKTAEGDDDSLKKLKQDLCLTSEEAFQVSGYQIFGNRAQDFANDSVREPIAYGDFDNSGRFHGCDTRATTIKAKAGEYFPCFQKDCTADHTYDENPLRLWEWPIPGAEYVCGADIAEGLSGRSDYSVGCVLRVSQSGGGDFHVATYRINTMGPIPFAAKLNHLGRFYNEALMSPEANRYDIVIGQLRLQYNYGNLYRWKHLDSINMMSSKLGWYTNVSSRPRLWQTFKSWLNQEQLHVRSHNLVEEMKNFVKDDWDDVSAGGDGDSHDDELMAGMIALYTAHETDYNDNLGMVVPKAELTMENAPYKIECLNCHKVWPQSNVQDLMIEPSEFRPTTVQDGEVKRVADAGGTRCPYCSSRAVMIQRNLQNARISDENRLWNESSALWTPEREWAKWEPPSYDEL